MHGPRPAAPARWRRPTSGLCLAASLLAAGCSLRSVAVDTVGDALASGESVYESEEDLELVGSALPFGLKLTESLLTESPRHHGLLLTACRGFTTYAYAFVAYDAERLADEDLDRARALRLRARRLFLRGAGYGVRALESHYPGLERGLLADPAGAVARIGPAHAARDVPVLYWTAAALGLAVSVSKDDAAMLARLPEVDALLDRALQLDEGWQHGALHEFKLTVAGARAAPASRTAIDAHYRRALALSQGSSPGLFVAYAEAVAMPAQDKAAFRDLLERALAIDPDRRPSDRLSTLVSQRRARWLLGRIDDLILGDAGATPAGSGGPP